MYKALALSLLSLVLLPPLRCDGQARPNPKAAAFGPALTPQPALNKCSSGVYEEPTSHALYWQTRGITVNQDGTETVHLVYRGEFRTQKEKSKQRHKALKECADWLDLAER